MAVTQLENPLTNLRERLLGGYVIAPGSIHPSGKVYKWARKKPELPLVQGCPGWLLDILIKQPGDQSLQSVKERFDTAGVLDGVPEGQRDEAIYKLACKLRNADVPQPAAEDLVLKAARNGRNKFGGPPGSGAFPEDVALEKVRRAYEQFKPGGSNHSAVIDWTDPEELPTGLPLVPPFDPRWIPEPFRDWLLDVAERMQCPLEFPTVGAIVALSGVIGRSAVIKPKQFDDWTVVPNVWGGIVGPPGIMKSPALEEALKPVRRLEDAAEAIFESEMDEFKSKQEMREVVKSSLRSAIKRRIANKQDIGELQIRLQAANKIEEPVPIRYVVNDSTTEKLGELLNQNERGLLLFRDELSGFLQVLDKEGHENDRAFYLETWNGKNRYKHDRIGRGTVGIKAACLSILGGIQPDPFRIYLRRFLQTGGGDGLIQRFQVLVQPDFPREFEYIDRKPNEEAQALAYGIFKKLDCATRKAISQGKVLNFRFDEEAQEYFREWFIRLEKRIRKHKEPATIEAWISKLRSLMPSLALIFHLIEVAAGKARDRRVGLQSAKRAALWCKFLEAHMHRIYQAVSDAAMNATGLLLAKIKEGRVHNPFHLRDVYRNGWSGLGDRRGTEEAVQVLEDYGWLKTQIQQTRGRSATSYHVNPKLKLNQGQKVN